MALSPVYREPAQALPSIRGTAHDRFHGKHDSPFSSSPAQAIPGMRSRHEAPPALPPPRFPFGEAPHAEEMRRPDKDFAHHGHAPSSMNSGYGSIGSSYADERPFFKRRDTSSTNGGDEGYASFSSTDRSYHSIPKEFGILHNSFQFQSPADLQVDSMKKKLDPSRHSENRSSKPPGLSLSVNDPWSRRQSFLDARLPPTLSLPVHVPNRSALDSPGRWTETSMYSAASPRSLPFPHSPREQRSPRDGSDIDRSPQMRTRRNNSDDANSTQGSFMGHSADEMDIDDNTSLKRLRLDDGYACASQKRQAPSPREDEQMLGLPSQIMVTRKNDFNSRGSPTPRLSTGFSEPPPSALSVSRSNSYASTPSASAGASSASAFGRLSPRGLSPNAVSPTSTQSPFTPTMSADPSPRTLSGRTLPHGRTASGASPRKVAEVQKSGGPKIQGFYMCDCCPKKPKKFETAEELQAHEAEKQYECNYCGNRFKNKNEAERHQNSLHVRRHSWSCSALSGYDRAFHDSPNRPGEADTCGYCGQDFPRSGVGPGNGALNGGAMPRYATEKDIEERNQHLQGVHKFRECNSSKKFFRADHFRQHLKHSHAGTSGKWTNMLENACMLEEEPPRP
ncbi:hypothetical protein NLU13_8850 [Sarocladium strictum]|uniref:C2H2-type domain-containing protein n=1 Tax=Sarocladium strictum TaxID=5046 RepID=A0AA39G9M8_SARSR|nr:hypothetical protein NLU13_8850 [Sarocladium strictum]